jgi:hypothetical protein
VLDFVIVRTVHVEFVGRHRFFSPV